MRLLTVGSLPPEWGGPVRGGAATFHAALLTGLLESDASVEVVGTLPPTPLDREIPVPAWVRPEEVGRARFYEDLLERLRPDAVLMNHVAHTIGVTHARLGSPVPALGVIHSWHSVTFTAGEERGHALGVTREALSGLGAMVAVSEHTMDEGERLGLEYPTIAETMIRRKEPIALVEAAVLLPDLVVRLVGEGELEEELRARIEALTVGDRPRDTRCRGDRRRRATRVQRPRGDRCRAGEGRGNRLGPAGVAPGDDRRLRPGRRDQTLCRAALPARRVPGALMSTGGVGGTAICVLGMSRTGTSLTSRVLSLAGVYLGPEEELLGGDLRQLAGEGEQVLAKARNSNPEGHWEHYRLMRLNERILRTLGGNWREPPPMAPGWESSAELAGLREEAEAILAETFAGHELWGWKDPATRSRSPSGSSWFRGCATSSACAIRPTSPLRCSGATG